MNAFKLLVAISQADKSLFDIPVEVQKKFLESQPVPKSLIDRSYNQYKAQMLFVPWWKVMLQNYVSLVSLPFVICLLLLKSIRDKSSFHVDAIGEFKGLEETLPDSIKAEYAINNDVWAECSSLTWNEMPFVIKLVFFRHPYFSLKIILKIAQYSYGIRIHKPRAIIVHNEYSFTSSALTAYCNMNKVKHINAMHGEKLFYIRDSWFCYDECYVWDMHYANLFVEMKADPTQFHIEIPASMEIVPDKHIKANAYADYKYYLANNTEDEIKLLADRLHKLTGSNRTIKVRLHPRYSNLDVIRRYFEENEIEFPKDVNIIDSISNTDNVIGSYTTVLVQAYLAGKHVILDDVVYKEQYDKLLLLRYIMAYKDTQKLSEI